MKKSSVRKKDVLPVESVILKNSLLRFGDLLGKVLVQKVQESVFHDTGYCCKIFVSQNNSFSALKGKCHEIPPFFAKLTLLGPFLISVHSH